MKQSAIDVEITNINLEINTLVLIRQRLEKLQANGDATGEPKVRKTRRKRTVGLPQATPPASEANHVKTGDRL